jgi:hypothetical protein
MKFQWEDFNHPKLKQLQNKYNLVERLEKGKDEFERQLILKNWVNKVLPHGKPDKDYSQLSSLEILTDAKKGKKFWCTQFTLLFIQAASSMGFYSRKLGVDTKDIKKDMHHGVADIWSRKFNKWYVVDAQHNLHYEKNGVPLNAFEIRKEYLLNKAREVIGVVGNYEEKLNYKPGKRGYNTPSNYFWFFVGLRNNFFSKPGIYSLDAFLWIDKYNQDKLWYRQSDNKQRFELHPMYKSQFIKTSQLSKCFPKIEEN